MKILLMFSMTLLFLANVEAKNDSPQDKVYLHILVDTLGYVTDVRIDSSDHDVLRQSAINTVRGIRFAQSNSDGAHAATWLPLIVTFNPASDPIKKINYTVTMERPPGESATVDKSPALIKAAAPVYPQKALDNKLEGRVVVEVLVDKNGGAKDEFVVETDNAIFNESALEAVGRFHFSPGTVNGQPIPAWVSIPIQYALPKKK